MVAGKSAKTAAPARHPLIESTPKKFGQNGRPNVKRDLTRCVRWPASIQLQRKRAVLLKKLKIPPALNQFNFAANKSQATEVLRLLTNYRPESPTEKKERLTKEAESRAKGGDAKSTRPDVLTTGLDDVVRAIELKKAKLVVIAHDVTPIELVCWLPALCRKMETPYVIIRGKARLGALIHKKKTAAVALCNVRPEHKAQLESLVKVLAPEFIDNHDIRRKWGNHHHVN